MKMQILNCCNAQKYKLGSVSRVGRSLICNKDKFGGIADPWDIPALIGYIVDAL